MGGKKEGKKEPKEPKVKHTDYDAEKKVWIGGLPEGTVVADLEKLFKKSGRKCEIASMMRKGQAWAAFKTEKDAAKVIETCNGLEVKGETVEVDVWTTKEKN